MSNSSSQLDNRLKLCADFVRKGAKLADIGTDHAYLPVWLCRIGRCPSAVAADINPEPLKRGQSTIIESGMSGRIETRLSDGLKEIKPDEADDIVIAGMGGELIAKILSECSFATDNTKHFILQPMTRSEVLIAWLCENGFKILRQDCCIVSGKCYTVLLVKYSGEKHIADEIYSYLGELSPKTNETHLRFVEGHLNILSKQAVGDVRFAVLADRIREKIYDND